MKLKNPSPSAESFTAATALRMDIGVGSWQNVDIVLRQPASGAGDRVAPDLGGTAFPAEQRPRSPVIDRSSSSPSAAPEPGAAHALLTRGPPPSTGQAPAASELADQAEISLLLIEDHDRIARSLNDIVIRRLFAAGLDLHTVLGLIGDNPGAGQIHQAIRELDLAIRDIRDAIFAPGTPDSRTSG
jgi:signal transduction histidine kinase